MAGEDDQKNISVCKRNSCADGTYFQVQIGTDIEDTKCSWLIVQAFNVQTLNRDRHLKDNYGKADRSSVLKVKKIYSELDLQTTFLEFEQESYSKLVSIIEKQESEALQAVLKSFLAKIYKRHK
ncbi:hypothetical protein O6H91_18G008800 [Diphasiastrum complanatum]|uniref:Uncharacterized protein n=1 Tax=Diphasiastrum complanatum TaxID=34168 RepID=A0ACC2AYT8_DIPCM|nr:hypothetical protein O6H91_18G008800 [Diphasiastrum complanatum]